MNLAKRAWNNRGNIVKAFSDKAKGLIPTNPDDYPDWYAVRMSKCAGCKHNTLNMDSSEVDSSFLKFFKKRNIQNCNICGCFIPEKCWVPSEMCAKHELGQEPEWGVIAIDRVTKEDLIIEVKDDTIEAFINQKFGGFIFDVGDRKMEDKISFDFSILSILPIHVMAWGTGCGCIANFKPVNQVDGRHIDFHTDFKIADVAPNGGEFKKGLNIRYLEDDVYAELIKENEVIDIEKEEVMKKLHWISFQLTGNVIKEG